MEIRSWFDGVQIEEKGKEYLVGRASKPAEMIEPGNRVYSVSGAGWDGFVVGGRISTNEDDEEYMAQSALMGPISS